MSDSSLENLKAFEERIKRIEGASRKTGRTSYKRSGEYFRKEEERKRQRRKGRKANWTFRILLVLACVLGVKTYIMVTMGAAAYDARMAELQAGDRYHKIAYAVMQPDPLTGKLQELLENSGILKPATALRGTAPAADAPAAGAAEAVAAPEQKEAGSNDGEPASGTSSDGVVTAN